MFARLSFLASARAEKPASFLYANKESKGCGRIRRESLLFRVGISPFPLFFSNEIYLISHKYTAMHMLFRCAGYRLGILRLRFLPRIEIV